MPRVTGCADSKARNFAADVNVHVSTQCEYAVYGCLFALATNYNPSATVDDSVYIV